MERKYHCITSKLIVRDVLHLAMVHNYPLKQWRELNLLRQEFITLQTLKHAKEHNYLADEQRDRWEGRASVNVVALTRFTTETQHYQQCNAATTDCDAKSCYDCITPELLALLYNKIGCPPAVVEFLYSALTQLEFSMSTAL
eukprot:1976507-Ditylum_brightwellii.AAC.1